MKNYFHLLVVCTFSIYPFEAVKSEEVLSLKKAIDLTLKNSLEIKSESFKSRIAATDLTLIRGEFLPKLSMTAGVGPINGKTGNYAGFIDQSSWGAEWIGNIEVKIPLFLWGRSEDLKKSVELNTEINGLDTEKKKIEVVAKLKEAFYGWQYALSLLSFVSDTKKDLEEAILAIADKKGKKEDLLRLEVFKYQVEEKKIEIEKSVDLARMGVGFYIGEELSLKKSQLINELDQRELKSIDYYTDLMNQKKQDLLKVGKGIQAKSGLLINEKKSLLPVFGALLKYDYAETNMRTAQNNPFIYDPYNHSSAAAGIGLTWNLDFGVSESKSDKLVLEIAELTSKEIFAKEGLKVLLTKAYLEVKEAEDRSAALKKAYKSAKKWLTNIETSVGLGLTPAKDIIDAYTTRALVSKDYYESLYRYQLAWAHLSEAVGVEVDPLL
jgi:hypothetical protein